MHAYLILAHNEFQILQKLVRALDCSENVIFIHYDKKVVSIPDIKAECSPLYVVPNRIDVRWGHLSQLEAEFSILEYALSKGPFSHYHIISGVHLPLLPISDINSFYDEHKDEEVVHVQRISEGRTDFKLGRYNFGTKYFKNRYHYLQLTDQFYWRIGIAIQKRLGIYSPRAKESFVKSDQWVSLTQMATAYMVSNKDKILKKYRYSFCPDEYFMATELTAAGFKLYDTEKQLYVVFNGESPRIITRDDYEVLVESGCMFARKFSSSHMDIVDKILETIL